MARQGKAWNKMIGIRCFGFDDEVPSGNEGKKNINWEKTHINIWRKRKWLGESEFLFVHDYIMCVGMVGLGIPFWKKRKEQRF